MQSTLGTKRVYFSNKDANQQPAGELTRTKTLWSQARDLKFFIHHRQVFV